VDTVEEVSINITTTITLADTNNLTNIKNNIQSEINKYLLDLRKTWENEDNIIVRISQIESRILNTDFVLDISNTKINNGTSNIKLNANQIPVLGDLEVSV